MLKLLVAAFILFPAAASAKATLISARANADSYYSQVGKIKFKATTKAQGYELANKMAAGAESRRVKVSRNPFTGTFRVKFSGWATAADVERAKTLILEAK